MMIRLYDEETGSAIGEITEHQLQFLFDTLEEESEGDQDYYIDEATLGLLEEEGADAGLLQMLKDALGSRPEMEVRWSRS
jgi:hypothetical protein